MKFGTKAENLSNIKIKYATIPKSIFFSVNQVQRNFDKCYLKIKSIFKGKIIIRSSAKNEDSQNSSNAGKFISVGNVPINKDIVKKTINKVIKSYQKKNIQDQVLVQEYINNSNMSGVVTTCNLDDYGPYYNINYSIGKKTDLVTSGKNNTFNTVIFRRSEKKRLNYKNQKIIALCRELEGIFNTKYLDIEFLFKKKKLYLLQVRPIVIKRKIQASKEIKLEEKISIGLAKLKKKIAKLKKKHLNLFGDTSFFGVMPDWNPAEIIGVKPKELAFSLYKELITDRIWAENRGNYGFNLVRSNQLMANFLGTPYIDVRVDFNSWLPQDLKDNFLKKLIKYYLDLFKKNKKLHDKIEFEILFTCFTPSSLKKLKNLNLHNFNKKEIILLKKSLKNITSIAINNLPKEITRIEILKSKQAKLLKKKLHPIESIYWLLEDCKTYGTSCFAGLARCGFIGIELLNSFEKEKIITPKEKVNFLLSIKSLTSEMNKHLSQSKKKFIKIYGHLRPNTYDICSKNYKEGYKEYFKNTKNLNKFERRLKFNFSTRSKVKINKFCKENFGSSMNQKKIINFIEFSIYYREYSKFIFSKSIDLVFENLKEIGRRHNISNEQLQHIDIKIIKDLYYNVTFENVSEILMNNINKNSKLYEVNKKIKLPEVLIKPEEIYCFQENESKINFVGSKTLISKIEILNNSIKNNNLRNKIVCIENADPGYDYIFNHKISGLITQYGGANSHMAIRCAELNLPAAIGIGQNLFKKLKNNKKVIIDTINKKLVFL